MRAGRRRQVEALAHDGGAGGTAGFRFVLLDLDAPTEYFVESAGVRSRPLPSRRDRHAVRRSGGPRVPLPRLHRALAPDGRGRRRRGGAAGHRGAPARRDHVPVPGGRLGGRRRGAAALELAADGTLGGLRGRRRKASTGSTFPGRDGQLPAGSPDYAIDVLADQPPIVPLLKPGRDAKVTSIEEVFTEMRGRGRLRACARSSSSTP